MATNRDDFNLNYLNLYQWTIWQSGMNIFTISFKSDLMWENETKVPHCRNNSKIEKKHRKRQIHDRSLSWLGTGTLVRSGGVQLAL